MANRFKEKEPTWMAIYKTKTLTHKYKFNTSSQRSAEKIAKKMLQPPFELVSVGRNPCSFGGGRKEEKD